MCPAIGSPNLNVNGGGNSDVGVGRYDLNFVRSGVISVSSLPITVVASICTGECIWSTKS